MPPQRSLLCSRSCSRSDRGTPYAFVQRSLPPLSFLLRSARTFAAADDAQSALVSVGGRARGTGRGESRAKSHTRRRGSATRRLSRLLSPRYGRAALRDSSVHCDGSVRAERGPAARSGRDRPVPSAGPRFRGDQVTAAAGRERLRGSPGAPLPRMASKGPTTSASTKSSSTGGTSGSSSSNGAGDNTNQDNTFECNICLDTAKDAVISLCGHLFCWPCLHQWLETRPNRQVCPVCKAGISRDKVIPLYGRGSTGQQDPREKTPPRPQGQRPEPENRGGFQGFGFGDGGFQMSFGIGAFPFGIFATAFNINDGRPPPAVPGTPQYVDEQFLSRLFLFVALVIMFWLLIA
eukprot:XP_015130813.1 E3 ubiquitin-protein ligase RNF185 isoform X1 [Gallus gallus]